MLSPRELLVLVSTVLSSVLLLSTNYAGDKEEKVLSSGYVEEVETTLVLLDMRVKDRQGEPVRGLGKGDFEISVDGLSWPVEAVDDFCQCARSSLDSGTQPGTGRHGAAVETPAEEEEGEAYPAGKQDREPFRFVFYLDHKQLDAECRMRAVRDAEHWVRDVMKTGDRAMVIASGFYLKELSPMTEDKTVLLAALEASADDPELEDVFPRTRWVRQLDCELCTGHDTDYPVDSGLFSSSCYFECEGNAIEEYQHSAQALNALRMILQRLGKIEGRKQLIYFNGSGRFFPDRLYYGARKFAVGDQVLDAEKVGAAATASRTAIFAPKWAWSDLNASLGNFSGGGRLSELKKEVERGCSCVYRIALKARGKKGKLSQIRVHVPRARQTVIFRSATPTKRDRWHAEVQLALMSPPAGAGIPLGVSLFPLGFDGKRWTLAVELAFELDSLLRMPGAGSARAEWGAGVFLTQNHNRRQWALEKFAAAEILDEGKTGARVVHRRVLDLRPGDYKAASYVGDLSAEEIGGGATALRLPSSDELAVVGPLLRRIPAQALVLELPDDGEGQAIEGSQVQTVASPIVPGSLRPGDWLRAVSWLCPGEEELDVALVWRYLSRGGDPLYRIEGPPAVRVDEGPCYRVLDTFELPEDFDPSKSYRYHIRWSEAQLESAVVLPVTLDGEK